MTSTAPMLPRSAVGRALSAAPASVTSRVLAGLIDVAVYALVWVALVAAARAGGMGGTPTAVALALVVLLPREIVLARSGWSVGGRLLKVRVIDADTGRAPMTRLFVHADLLLITLLPTLGLGALLLMRAAAKDPHGQGWHDRLAGVRVITTAGPTPQAEAPWRARSSQPEEGPSPGPGVTPPPGTTPPGSASPSGPVAPRTGAAPADELFPDNRFAFSPEEVRRDIAHTFDTTSVSGAQPESSPQAIIDSVPWSAVPTYLDSPTADEPDVTRFPTWAATSPEPMRSAGSPVSGQVPAQAPIQGPPSSPGAAGTPAPAPSTSTIPVPVTPTSKRLVELGTGATPADAPTTLPPASPMRSRRTARLRIRLVPVIGGDPIPLIGPTVMGRDPQNISDYPDAERVSLPDATRSISKTHAAVAPVPGGVWVTDLHSTNGTRVEHKDRIEAAVPGVPSPAPTGSIVVLGRAAYRVEA
ncbi:RDD family protein [Actinomyces howellii]|uniref:RDD family n=1 Tax=Actinomyces howellii TaxID=52771 RepID=A0A448HIW9_9ACTO|nr:RDD family protein [Actinomyces howellii]VEG29629.1 RDD family [Actinomyces howellii]